jgi:hypothetical protein
VTTTAVIAYIVIPLVIFLMGAAITGITGLVKFVRYMEKSQAAQESTASSNQEINDKLDKYMGKTDTTLIDHTTRIAVLENRAYNSRGHP